MEEQNIFVPDSMNISQSACRKAPQLPTEGNCGPPAVGKGAFIGTGAVLAAPAVAAAAPGAYAWSVGTYQAYLGVGAGSGAVILGRYPEFVDVAEESGAQYLNIGMKTFERLENMGVAWQADQAFLNGVLNQGARIINASGADRFSWNSYWAFELLHLQSKGFPWPF